jgi:hypothetical protein
MDDRLKQEIENNAIASVKPGQGAKGTTPKSPLNTNSQVVNIMTGEPKDSKFFRSKRSVAMRIKDNYETQVQKLETEKLQLIQKLNDALVQLDKLN